MSMEDDFAVVKAALSDYDSNRYPHKYAGDAALAALSRLQQQAKEQEAALAMRKEICEELRERRDELKADNERLRALVEEAAKQLDRVRSGLRIWGSDCQVRDEIAGECAALHAKLTGTADAKPEAPAHAYTSTACHHKQHKRCRKSCKFCAVACGCECHTETRTSEESSAVAPAPATECAHDVSNLRFYARLFEEHKWQDPVIHWGVFHQTLNEIASRIETLRTQLATANERAERARKESADKAEKIRELVKGIDGAEYWAPLDAVAYIVKGFRQLLAEQGQGKSKQEAEQDAARKDTELLDWLEMWLTENRYRHDLALQSDEEDGVWFAKLYRHECGQLRGSPLDPTDGKPLTVRDAIRAAIVARFDARQGGGHE